MDQKNRVESAIGDLEQTLRKVNLPYADGLYDMQETLIIQKNKDRENISTRIAQGVSLRGYNGRGWLYSSSNRTDLTTMRRLVERLRESQQAHRGRATLNNRLSVPEPIKLDKQLPVRKDPRQVAIEEKMQKIRDSFTLARSMDSRIVDIRVNYSESLMDRVFLASHGTRARQRIPRTRFALQAILKDGGITEYDLLTAGGAAGYEVIDALTEDAIRATVQGAAEQLKATSPPRGLHTVIIDPGTVGVVCHESFGHGLEADQALRERSYLRAMLGKRVASEHVTIYEDSSLEGGHGSYYFDDDGVPSRKNSLVENGVLVSFLHDIETSAAMNSALTASSRTQDTSRRRFIRMSNTYSKPGDWTIDEMIRETKSAVMMMRWQFGIEDPLGGGMQVVSKKGYLIENGSKTKPLRSITLTGRVLDILRNVDAVSKDGFMVDAGNCGKGKEDFVPVASGGTWWRTTGVIA